MKVIFSCSFFLAKKNQKPKKGPIGLC